MQRLLTMAVLLLSTSSLCAQSRIAWLSTWQEATLLAQRNHRLVLIHFTSHNCPPCVKLEQTVLNRPEVIRALMANYVPLKVDVDQDAGLARYYNVQQWPTDVIVDDQGRELFRGTSPLDANRYIATLDQVAAHARIGAPISGSPATDVAVTPGAADAYAQPAAYLPGQPGLPPSNTIRQPWDTANAATQGVGSSVGPNGSGGEFVTNQYVPGQTWQPPRRDEQVASYDSPDGQFPTDPVTPASAATRQDTQFPVPPALTSQLRQPASPGPQVGWNQFASPGNAGTTPAEPASAPALAQAPAGPPTLALEGYCCVSLVEQEKWVKGDALYGAIHRGRTYLFASPEAQQRFLADFDRYAPALSGYDCVQYSERGVLVDGKRAHGVFYQGQIFLFADEDALQKFWAAPDRFLPAVLAEQQRHTTRR